MGQLFRLLGRYAPVKLIEFFLDNPTGEFHEKEVEKKTGLAKASVGRWLKELVDMGFLLNKQRARLSIHYLNKN